MVEGVVPPLGTVSFLFTDIVGSTRLWEAHPDGMAGAVERHDAIVRMAVGAHGGHIFSTAGDSFGAAFARGTDAIEAALQAQRWLVGEDWPPETVLAVRMGVCAGEAQERDGNYFGSAVNRAARLMSIAHGGQVLVSDALRQIVTGRLSPGLELVDLGEQDLKDLTVPERVWQLRADGLMRLVAPLRVAGGKGNLRPASSVFVGRTDELSRLIAALGRNRLITLTGVGGVGKTRLALEAASLAADEYDDGIWVCELGAVDDPDGVPYAVATTVGAQIGPGDTATEAVTAWLAGRRVLLVVDNCEHVIDAAAALVQAIQQSCPTVSMLATSREGLSLDGEHQWPVRSLEPELEGVQLFCDRAVAADVSFTASSADLAQIVRICRRVDGIPLAIELAAARVRSLNPVDLAERLDDRFRLLRGARRGGIERHQTMHATVQWSYRLLEDDQRALFDRLCVFSGGFDLQAAESVCADASVDAADVVDLLAALVDKSMVIVDRSAPHVRYRLLETLRQFGEEQLADTDLARVRDAHGAYYVAVATDADARFSGEDWDGGAAVFATEWDNLRAGVGWALIKGYLDLARQLVEATSWYGVLKLRYEHHDWANQTLTLAADSDRPAPTAVAGVSGWWYANKNQPAPVLDLAESGLRAAPTRHARSTNWCWHATCIAHRHAEDRNKYEQALAAWNKANQDPRDRFHRMLRASYQAWWGTPEQTAQALTMAESLQRECPNPSLDVWTFWIQGMAEASLGHTEQALEAYHHCLELAQATGHHVMESTAALFTGRALLNAGDGIRVREERLILDTARQHRMSIGSTLTHFAQRLLANGYVEPAAVLLGHVHNRYEDSPFLRIEPTLQEINCETGSSGWVAQGESLDTQEAFTYALAVLDDISST